MGEQEDVQSGHTMTYRQQAKYVQQFGVGKRRLLRKYSAATYDSSYNRILNFSFTHSKTIIRTVYLVDTIGRNYYFHNKNVLCANYRKSRT